MKKFLKVFGISFAVFGVIALCFVFFVSRAKAGAEEKTAEINEKWYEETVAKLQKEQEEELLEEVYAKDPLMLAIRKSKRINVVVMGLEKDPRTDVIIFASCDPETQEVDLISIPRDTYLYEAGYENAGHKKINSYYGKKDENGELRREEGTKQAVSEILGVPIHHFVSVSYSGVEEVVNAIGGVTVDVPMDMKYDDPTDKPPLHINIPKGTQHLDGLNTVHFMRYRHGNLKPGGGYYGGYPDGDLGRIKAQQQVIKEVIKKSISLNLPKVVEKSLQAVRTDMNAAEMIAYATTFANFDTANLHMSTLPGEPDFINKISFFIKDADGIKEVLKEIYNVEELEKELAAKKEAEAKTE